MEELENTEEDQTVPISKKEMFSFIWEMIRVIIVSLAIIIPIRYYVVQPFFVKGASMESTFENNDYILIDELSYFFRDPRRDEIIVFRSPENSSQFFIKRIIGLPGDTVKIENNKVSIFNDQSPEGLLLNESSYLDRGQETRGNITMTISSSNYFVMGDNRLQSSDSRRWGELDKSLITGKVFIRIWPLNKIKRF